MSFRLTYSTMFNPPEEMHERFDAALQAVRSRLSARHACTSTARTCLPGATHACRSTASSCSATSRSATPTHVDAAMRAAQAAFPAWRATPPASACDPAPRRRADRGRVYEIAPRWRSRSARTAWRRSAKRRRRRTSSALRATSRQQRLRPRLARRPAAGLTSHNRSVLQPYGVWGVIAPFNFPLALAGGPVAAALVTGNTVVLKGASDTPWAGRLLADCIRDAGVPPGVFNYVIGYRHRGRRSADRPSDARRAHLHRLVRRRHAAAAAVADGGWPRPCIAEMGGKNPCIVTARADLERAGAGIVRSAYGMGGQKCSALSRLYVEHPVADALIERLRARRRRAAHRRPDATRALDRPGRERARPSRLRALRGASCESGGAHLLAGGRQLHDGALARGQFVAPTLAEAPPGHRLWHAGDVPADPDAAARARSRARPCGSPTTRTWD